MDFRRSEKLKKNSKVRVIVFGTGQYWNNRKKAILENCNIVCFLDNDSVKWNLEFCGVKIENPNNILQYKFDYVVVMCKSKNQVYSQMISLGVPEEKIIDYNQIRQICLKNSFFKYGKNLNKHYDIILISTVLDYSGGTMAAIYAFKALQRKGKSVLLCSDRCDEKLLDELITDDFEILVAPGLPIAINDLLLEYIKKCEVILINVFQMLPLVSKINGLKPIMWWIHEPKQFYTEVLDEFPQYDNQKFFSKINIVAVSRIAKNNFNRYFHNIIKKDLTYGIPDMQIKENKSKKDNNVTTFAVIGGIIRLKAQDVFINSIEQLTKEERSKSKFYIIGSYSNDKYANSIINKTKEMKDVIVTGGLTRKEIANIYSEIDVVVCPSREETMSIVLTEAMMYGKPSISSDNTGMADYIENGINGFICKTEDAEDLCEKMRYFIHHTEKIEKMGQEARKVYEKYFTMDKFADRLCVALDETIRDFNDKVNM